MECPIEAEMLELLYNQQAICYALLQEGVQSAKQRFHQRVIHLHRLNKGMPDVEKAIILLSALNYGLYHALQCRLNISLASCCHTLRVYARTVHDLPSLLHAGDQILDTYAAALNGYPISILDIACAYIQTHLDMPLSLEKVSAEIHISKCRMCQLFKAKLGCSFCCYVRRQRIEQAKELLRCTAYTIEVIADACGFRSVSYFSTVFKEETGVPPSQFREAQVFLTIE